METSRGSPRHGHRLIQVGMLLFLLALFVGLAIPRFALPRLALSTHLLGIMQGTFLMVSGLLWTRLRFRHSVSFMGACLAVYGSFAAWFANLCGALWGAGSAMVPIAAGQARGSAFQEGVIRVLLVTAAVSLIATALLMLGGLRGPGESSDKP